MSLDTILFAAMMLCIGFYANSAGYWKYMPPIALYNAGFVWILFLVCRYLKTGKLIRAGISSILTGAFIFSTNNVINSILDETLPWPRIDLSTWNPSTADGNIKWIILLGSIFIGFICIVIGIMRGRES